MLQNVYIIGAQSTGKSTIVSALETHFTKHQQSTSICPRFIREVARGVLSRHQFTSIDIVESPDRALELQRLVIEAQALAEHKAADTTSSSSSAFTVTTRSPPLIISDRSVVDPIVYARQYVGLQASRELMAMEEWRQMRDRMAASLIVVCEAGVRWLADDGVRLMPRDMGEWQRTHELFCHVLDEASLSYVVLPKDLTDIGDRVAFVLDSMQHRAALACHNGESSL